MKKMLSGWLPLLGAFVGGKWLMRTLENRPLFLCRVMVFGTWEDICFALDHHGKTAFREALQSATPGLFDNHSWHYWHHRLQLLPVPPPPQRALPA
jgi:hypothetical protein